MANIKYVARALQECFLGGEHLHNVAYFVSKADVTDGVVLKDATPFIVADFSALFKNISFGRTRKGFVVENGDSCYKLQCFDEYDDCRAYVDKLNNSLLEAKLSILGEDRAAIKRHIKDVDYAKKFEKFFIGEIQDLQLGEE